MCMICYIILMYYIGQLREGEAAHADGPAGVGGEVMI